MIKRSLRLLLIFGALANLNLKADTFPDLISMSNKQIPLFAKKKMYAEKVGDKYRWITYEDFGQQVAHMRSALHSLGVASKDKIAVIGPNSIKFAVITYATLGLGAVSVPMDIGQSPEDLVYKVKDSDAKVLFIHETALTQTLKDGLKNLNDQEKTTLAKEMMLKFKTQIEAIEALEHVVLFEDNKDNECFHSLLEKGKSDFAPVIPSPNDDALIIYTSGTTGKPKGVVLTHKNIMAVLNPLQEVIEMHHERSLAFLPWSHVMGQVAEMHALIMFGNSAGFPESKKMIMNNIQEIAPTILFAVPPTFQRVYDVMHDKNKVDPKHMLRFKRASDAVRNDKTPGLMDRYVAHKVRKGARAKFGGEIKFAVSGAAKLDPKVGAFMEDLKIIVLEGYGMSETAGLIAANTMKDKEVGTVGKQFPGVTVEIAEDPEAQLPAGHGEIIVKGDNIMKGYYKLPEETAECFDKKGWFHTGDIGVKDKRGFITITGRKKDRYKLSKGEYVAPLVFETAAKENFFQEAFMWGDNKDYSVAVLVIKQNILADLAKSFGVKESLTEPKIREAIKAEVSRINREFEAKSEPLNTVKRFVVVDDVWTAEDGILTSTLKVKRPAVLAKYKEIIEKMYSQKGDGWED